MEANLSTLRYWHLYCLLCIRYFSFISSIGSTLKALVFTVKPMEVHRNKLIAEIYWNLGIWGVMVVCMTIGYVCKVMERRNSN